MDQQAFLRKLFLIRYSRLLQKAEKTYALSPAVMEVLRDQILQLDWIDVGVSRFSRSNSEMSRE
jgi:hypothetical protein